METTKNSGIIIAFIIGICLVIGSLLIALAWRANSRDITNRKLLDLQREINEQNLESIDLENKRKEYMDCLSLGSKALTKYATADDVELIMKICKDKTGYTQ